MMAVALRSACRQALGAKGKDPMKSITSSRAATSRGAARLLASGMKISAEPKPENPRAVPETKAIAQIAIAALRPTPSGIRLARFIPVTPRKRGAAKGALRPLASSPQTAAGLLGHFRHDLGRDRVDLLVGQGFFAGLDRHRDRDRLLA